MKLYEAKFEAFMLKFNKLGRFNRIETLAESAKSFIVGKLIHNFLLDSI